MVVVERTRAYRSHRNHPALPAQWFYGLYRALPGAPGVLATVAPERLSLPRNLTPASGCQDHTTSHVRFNTVRYRRIRVHRIPSRGRDDRDSPLFRDGTAVNIAVICTSENQNIFSQWAGQGGQISAWGATDLPVRQTSSARSRDPPASQGRLKPPSACDRRTTPSSTAASRRETARSGSRRRCAPCSGSASR
jgi:hypothetical protein